MFHHSDTKLVLYEHVKVVMKGKIDQAKLLVMATRGLRWSPVYPNNILMRELALKLYGIYFTLEVPVGMR
jgi:hypothetical protein